MKLIPLGTGPACPRPGGACSGYLVADGSTTLLLDCGTGVVSNLRLHIDFRLISAIFISHLHADHCLDLVPYRYGLVHGPDGPPPERVPLYLPPGGTRTLMALASPFGGDDFFSGVFDLREFCPGSTTVVGSLRAGFHPTPHYVPAYAIAVESGSRRLVYSADSGITDNLAPFVAHGDLFLCEATLPEDRSANDAAGHLSGADAARIAQEAGAKKLMITHTWTSELASAAARAARAIFSGPVEVAEENVEYEI